jgi:hypothetical protein
MTAKNTNVATVAAPSTTTVEVKKTYWTKEVAEAYIKEKGSVSKAIRQLASEDMPRADIAKNQHVRNVLNQPIKKA